MDRQNSPNTTKYDYVVKIDLWKISPSVKQKVGIQRWQDGLGCFFTNPIND